MGLLAQCLARARAATPIAVSVPAYAARISLVAGGYVVAALLANHFVLPASAAGPLWPSAALALCACLAWGLAVVPAVWAGAAVAAFLLGFPAAAAIAIGTGCAIEAALGAGLATSIFSQRADVVYHERIFRFVAAAVGSSMVSATVGTVALAETGRGSAFGLGIDWLAWIAGDASAMLIAAPLLLSWGVEQTMRWPRSKIVEALLLALATVTTGWVVFRSEVGHLPFAYLTFCPLLWAAFRFPLAVESWTAGTICVLAAWGTARGYGPFAHTGTITSLFLLTTYTGVLSTSGLVLAGLVHQRRDAEARLRAEHSLLEERLQERTASLRDDIEHRKRIERQLADAQRLAQIGSWQWNTVTGEISWSDELYRICGVDKAAFTPSPEACKELIAPEDVPRLQQEVRDSLQNGRAFQLEHQLHTRHGPRTVLSRGYLQDDGRGSAISMFGTVQDITEVKQVDTALREAEARYRTLVEMSPDAILVLHGGRFVYANDAACSLLQADDCGAVVGKAFTDLIHPDSRGAALECLVQLTDGSQGSPIEERLHRRDGSLVDVEINASPITHNSLPAMLLVARDITERRKSTEQMAYMAHYDALTGLPNRVLFHQRLEHALSVAQRPGKSVEILFLDLDRFKNINDTLGHAAGDLVLQEAARRLQGILRESDTVARLGGDEFVVLVENVDEPHRGGVIAEKILAAFKPPFLQQQEPLSVSTSIGIASFPSDGTDAQTLLKNADIAMYRAKEMGRHTYCYYSPELNRHTTERLTLEYALGAALEHGEFALYYQPRIDLPSNRITGMEALLRWWHPTLGAVAPERFIPIAEETGLILPIGYWALRTACAQNRRWQDGGTAPLRVSVNMSQRQLSDGDLIDNIRAILDDTGLEARYLEIEITEGTMMSDPDKAVAVVRALSDMGISVSIDDFGTGYSSLSHLKQFPIGAVKIDPSFVRGLPANQGDSAITRAIIGLAHTLDCKVIAEGAETQQQFEFLRDHDCDSVQGYYFSAPMAADMFGELLKSQSGQYLH